MSTAYTCKVAAAPEMSSTGVASATTVLCERWFERQKEGSREQDNSTSERQAKPTVTLHVRTLSANRGGRQRFYTIRRGIAWLRCCPHCPRVSDWIG